MSQHRFGRWNVSLAVATSAILFGLHGAHAQAQVATPSIDPAVNQGIARVLAAPVMQRVLQAVKDDHERSLSDLKMLTEIPAPPFKETARAEAFLARAKALGLDARIDAEGNVIAVRKGVGRGPKLLVSAHLDTVFPEGTDVRVKVRDGKWFAPGISDDTRGLAVLLSWAKVLNDLGVQTVGDLMIVANVGEEELGDLRGIKAVFRDHTDIDGMVGMEPDPSGSITTGGVGSHRYEVIFKGPGGHSYVTFGQPSAIHAMARAVAKIADVRTPSDPKTTFTVGTVGGGTAVNAIAAEARIAIDIRSADMKSLLDTERQILAAVAAGVAEENQRWDSKAMTFTTRLIGDRPGGNTQSNSPIVQAAISATTALGRPIPKLVPNSSDANVPMSLGIPAVIVSNGGESGGWHTTGEWWDPASGWKDAQIGLTTVLALVGINGVSEPLLRPRK
ncbi:M20/M25/M40 family metallo-hydrolase [Variovorax sp. J31P207]|uniref:M20/M25/M40 family metallo-hydrolase n=1 Tax=Variovorax sp. J31P207 TaxID=3053510 RepID=UPI002578B2D5|nr:M20/M25/M40 family metallo-hydrolase [Variovorax sp. J31P207]MDM0070699.1 M20/M25/M40 family metallo-hydrolase [Variovorax sp. J31P207]